MVPETFVNSSPSPVKFRFYTDSTEWRKTCTTPPYRWLFPDSRPSLKTLSSAVIKSPYFSFRRTDLICCLRKWVWTLCFRFCVSTFEASPSRIEFSLAEECASACVSRFSRLTVKCCYQSGMPCVGSSLFVSSFVCWFTVLRGLLTMICQHRFPACMLVTSSRYWIWSCSQFSWTNWTDPLMTMLRTNCC